MTAVLETSGLGKRYGRRWALPDCTLSIPEGKVVGLVGPNGAGKTTLLHLAVGLLAPTSGSIEVLGGRPADGPAQLGRVGFVAQDTPTYAGLSVAKHLRMGAYLNPGWDDEVAQRRIEQLGLDPRQRAGSLSGGQRAQLALTLAIAKRPELLLLDEPVASLDPLARREFLQMLMEVVAEQGVSVVLSSHLVADLERVCDYLVVLVASHVQLAGEISGLLASHRRLSGPRRDPGALPANQEVIEESHTDRQSTLLVRTDDPILDPAWTVKPVTLEDLVLAYMGRARDTQPSRPIRVGGPAMIRSTWIQFRTQAVVAIGGLVVVAVVLAVTGPHLVHLYDTTVATCAARGDCSSATSSFLRNDHGSPGRAQRARSSSCRASSGSSGGAAGRPGARDRHLPPGLDPERHPHPLAGREARPRRPRQHGRRRALQPDGHLVVQPDRPGHMTVVHHVRPTQHRRRRLRRLRVRPRRHRRRADPPDGARHGRHAGGPRDHPAARLLLSCSPSSSPQCDTPTGSRWVRRSPATAAPSGQQASLFPGTPTLPNAWILSTDIVDKSGHSLTGGVVNNLCPQLATALGGPGPGASQIQGGHVAAIGPAPAGANQALQACVSKVGATYHELVSYQPPGHYWPLQWSELALYLGAAFILGGICLWRIRRHLA